MIYGSVCSGIEAASVAWGSLGWRPAWFAEIDPLASAVLAHRFPEVRNLGDFTTIRGHWLKRTGATAIDLLAGGTPCVSFSVAGCRLGLDDPRGNLTLEFLRLAKRRRPRWIVWENVPGVLSIDSGRTFGTVLGTMVELGYGIAYRILDAQFFGVPQRRRRVFVVGHLGAWQPAAAVLFERESLRRNPAPRGKTPEIVTAITANSLGTCGSDAKQAQAGHLIPFGGNNASGPIDVATACNAHGGTGRMDFATETLCVQVAPPLLAGANRTGGDRFPGMSADTYESLVPIAFSCKDSGADAIEDVAPTLRAMGHDLSHPNAGGQVAVVFEARFARNGRGAPDVIAPPLKAQSGSTGRGDGAPLLASWVAVRRLTPRECERLQGFPDDWTLIPNYRQKLRADEVEEIAAYLRISPDMARALGATPDGPRYKAIGNSMAVPVMRWIGQRIDHVDAALREGGMTAHMGFGLEALRRAREQEERLAQPESPPSLLAQVPPDAPCDNPDAVLHVWNGERWVPWQKWLASAPIARVAPEAVNSSIPADADCVFGECGGTRVWLVRDGDQWLMFVGSRKASSRRKDFASAFLGHAIRAAEEWYGAPMGGWRAETDKKEVRL